jgi:hypothetical protein
MLIYSLTQFIINKIVKISIIFFNPLLKRLHKWDIMFFPAGVELVSVVTIKSISLFLFFFAKQPVDPTVCHKT